MGNRSYRKTRKNRRRAFRHKKRGGTSPLNPSHSTSSSTSTSTMKRKKGKTEKSLHRLVLLTESYKKVPSGPRKTPVKRNFVVVDEPVRRKSI